MLELAPSAFSPHWRSVGYQRYHPFRALHPCNFPIALCLFEVYDLDFIAVLVDVFPACGTLTVARYLWIDDRDDINGAIGISQVSGEGGRGSLAARPGQGCQHRAGVARQVPRHIAGTGGIEH